MQLASSSRARRPLSLLPRASALRALAPTLAMCVAAALAGCGGQSKSPAAPGTVPASTRTSATSTTSTNSTSATTTTPARTSSAPHVPGHVTSTSASAAPPSPRSPAVAPGRRYAGFGNRAIGTIALKSPVVLSWNAASAKIQVFTSTGFVLVKSRRSTGSVQVSKGTYRGVRVASAGAWSLLLAPFH